MEMSPVDNEQHGQHDGQQQDPSVHFGQHVPQAPAFKIPSRTISAVEHPFLVMDIEKGLETFGPNPQFQAVLNPGNPHLSVPIYLHPEDPTSRPMMSHYASSHNVVFKITVPKRTGRKRKRGSDGPWEGEVQERSGDPSNFKSLAKLDEPRSLRRRLQDNADKYHAEAVGVIKHTHRYRGMVDFNYSMKNNTFMTSFAGKIMSGDVSKFREVSIKHGTDTSSNQEIIAPPLMTQINVPYYYHYTQNPYVKAVDKGDGGFEMVNTTAKIKSVGHFIGIKDAIPPAPSARPKIRDPMFDDVLRGLQMCMAERPVWTRRSILNRLVTLEYDPKQPEKRIPTTLSQQIVKHAIQLVGYQFKGGPWRDALVRYGYDPRADASGRIYQTLIFQLRRLEIGSMGELWQEIRKRGVTGVKGSLDEHVYSHIFDGKTYSEDGKVWQVCDITDPLLKKLFGEAEPRQTCDIDGSGWYHRGLWAKTRAIMKCKMRAIQFGRELRDSDFQAALQTRDETPELDSTRTIAIPTPDLNLTDAEWEMVRGKRYKGVGRQRKNKRSSYHFHGNTVPKHLKKTNTVPSQLHDGMKQIVEHENGEILQTVEEEEEGDDVGARLTNDYEDGSEYDEDEGEDEEEEEEDDESEAEEDYDEDENLAERLRLAQYDYSDEEQAGDDDEEPQDEEEEDEQD